MRQMNSTVRSSLSRVRLRGGLLLGSLALFASACGDDKPLNTFEPRGPAAKTIDNLAIPMWYIMGFVFVVVVFGGIGLAIKNRVKPEDYDPEDLPEQVHGNPALEWGWTAIPAILLALISIPTIITIWDLEEKNADSELDVMVIGQQWWWEYRYDIDGDGFFEDVNGDGVVDDTDKEWPLEISLDDDDLVVANQLVIPAGEQVDMLITSRDVIHSYWLPRLNGKRDAVPGRIHSWSVEADEPGEFTGWCTEFCGLSHARMRMSAVALEPAEFDAWLENQSKPAEIPSADGTAVEQLAAQGRALFQSVCTSCHVIDEDLDDPDAHDYGANFEAALVAKGAPNLTHFATRSVFAGAIYSQYVEVDADDDDLLEILEAKGGSYVDMADTLRLNEGQLRRWIKDAPSQKAMDPENFLGMPAFPQLTEADLVALVAYLATLD